MRPIVLRRVVIVLAALLMAAAAFAAKKSRDQIWTRADYAQLKVDRIALIPVTSYDNNIQNENQVEASLGPALRSSGYRWISGTSVRELLRARAGSDSLLKVLRGGILAQGRLDSLGAPAIAKLLGCDAMLTVRVDRFERHEVEWNVAGKPSTTVQMHAALVDSAGRLLWSANGTELGEGPYYDPSAGAVAVKDNGLDRTPVSGQAGPPSYREVLTLIFARWAEQFPAHATRAPAPADSTAAPH